MSYPVGSLVRLTATFLDSGSTVYDPSGVTVKYREPSGTETTLTYAASQVTRSATGVYYVDLDTTGKPGNWWVRCYSPQNSGQAASFDLQLNIVDTKA